MDSPVDKQWAKAYILDPLTAPEPSQETGIASSHSLSNHMRQLSLSPSPPSKSSHQNLNRSQYPTPPTSASPSRSSFRNSFHPSNPFADSNSPSAHSENLSPPNSPPTSPSDHRRYPPSTSVTRSASTRAAGKSPQYRPQPRHSRSHSAEQSGHNRNSSLSQRFPGDMSHRPLDIIRREARAADRSPHLRSKSIPATDTIDALDTIGGTYHHGGPYDATLASRNRNTMYAPVAAVHDSNMAAIRATPREFVDDSLQRHRPLQGTAIIPNGGYDLSGQPMNYEEGADLMREPDAAGGPYKRWDGIQYLPEDLKGKGEPSFTYERDMKAKKRASRGQPAEYEMQSGLQPPRLATHHRSVSNDSSMNTPRVFSSNVDLGRSNSTGKRLSDGLKRRFGSIRRKKAVGVN